MELDEILEDIMTKAIGQIILQEDKLLKSFDELGTKEFRTLDVIFSTTKSKTNTSNNIAKLLDITPGTLTTNLDRLSAKGYVYKEKSESDKRVVYVFLTPLGQNLRKKRETAHKNMIKNVTAKLSPTEKVALMSALNKII